MSSSGARNASLAALTPDAIRAIIAEELAKSTATVAASVVQNFKEFPRSRRVFTATLPRATAMRPPDAVVRPDPRPQTAGCFTAHS